MPIEVQELKTKSGHPVLRGNSDYFKTEPEALAWLDTQMIEFARKAAALGKR